MTKNSQTSFLKHQNFYLTAIYIAAFVVVTCTDHAKKVERDELNDEIAKLNKEICETNNIRNANVPKHLKSTQSRYIKASDSLDKNYNMIDTCFAQDEDLLSMAFNKYAIRIGHDFQISTFLSKNDIAVFQKDIAKLDTMDYIREMARKRILDNRGSLHDLSYFFEMLDFDSVNTKLENKLEWKFYFDTSIDDQESIDISVITFNNSRLDNLLSNEKKLLNTAWIKSDSNTDNTPNFEIPEFDSVRTIHLSNKAEIDSYKTTFNTMLRAEDSLENYTKELTRKRDSLLEKQNELNK